MRYLFILCLLLFVHPANSGGIDDPPPWKNDRYYLTSNDNLFPHYCGNRVRYSIDPGWTFATPKKICEGDPLDCVDYSKHYTNFSRSDSTIECDNGYSKCGLAISKDSWIKEPLKIYGEPLIPFEKFIDDLSIGNFYNSYILRDSMFMYFEKRKILKDFNGLILDLDRVRYDKQGDRYGYFSVDVEGKYDSAIAFCQTGNKISQFATPKRCILVEFELSRKKYYLAMADSGAYEDKLCPASASFRTLTPYQLPNKIGTDDVSKRLFDTLINGSLKLSESSYSSTNNARETGYGEIVISAESEPRISLINSKLREKIDLLLRVRFRHSEREDVISYTISGKMNAYVGRQNIDPSGNWRMPENSYYDRLERMIFEAFQSTMSGLCVENSGRELEFDSSEFDAKYQCVDQL